MLNEQPGRSCSLWPKTSVVTAGSCTWQARPTSAHSINLCQAVSIRTAPTSIRAAACGGVQDSRCANQCSILPALLKYSSTRYLESGGRAADPFSRRHGHHIAKRDNSRIRSSHARQDRGDARESAQGVLCVAPPPAARRGPARPPLGRPVTAATQSCRTAGRRCQSHAGADLQNHLSRGLSSANSRRCQSAS